MMLFYALWKVHTPNSKFSLVLLNEGQPHAASPPASPPGGHYPWVDLLPSIPGPRSLDSAGSTRLDLSSLQILCAATGQQQSLACLERGFLLKILQAELLEGAVCEQLPGVV